MNKLSRAECEQVAAIVREYCGEPLVTMIEFAAGEGTEEAHDAACHPFVKRITSRTGFEPNLSATAATYLLAFVNAMHDAASDAHKAVVVGNSFLKALGLDADKDGILITSTEEVEADEGGAT